MNVKSAQELVEAAMSSPGGLIVLEPGHHGPIVLRGVKPAAPLVVEAAGAIVEGVEGDGVILDGCSDVRVVGLAVSGWSRGVVVRGSSGITLARCDVGGCAENGVAIKDCDGVRVEGCAIHGTCRLGGGAGLNVGGTTGFGAVENHLFDNCRSGVALMDGTTGFAVDGNRIYMLRGARGCVYVQGASGQVKGNVLATRSNKGCLVFRSESDVDGVVSDDNVFMGVIHVRVGQARMRLSAWREAGQDRSSVSRPLRARRD